MLLRVALGTLLLGGCQYLFEVDPQQTPDGPPDSSDDSPVDAPIDVVLANHDEDGDGMDDAIDKCPTRPDPDQVDGDGDGDGVGDACDPRPTSSGDEIYHFDPFVTLDLSRWTSIDGAWMANGNDQIEQTNATAGLNSLLLLDALQGLQAPTVEVVVAEQGTIDAGVYLKTGGSGALPEGVACYVDKRFNQVVYFENRPGILNQGGTAGVLKGSAVPIRIALQSTGAVGGGPLCTGQRADSTMATSTTNPNVVAGIALAAAGLYTFEATAKFNSVIVYRVGDGD